MSIVFRYFQAGPDGFYESPGKMILSDRMAIFDGENGNRPESEFNYTPVNTWVEIRDEHKKRVRHAVNYLFTEQNYGVGQREMMAHLGWMQKQKLQWMYSDHWLQRPGNLRHMFVIVLIISLLIATVSYLELASVF